MKIRNILLFIGIFLFGSFNLIGQEEKELEEFKKQFERLEEQMKDQFEKLGGVWDTTMIRIDTFSFGDKFDRSWDQMKEAMPSEDEFDSIMDMMQVQIQRFEQLDFKKLEEFFEPFLKEPVIPEPGKKQLKEGEEKKSQKKKRKSYSL